MLLLGAAINLVVEFIVFVGRKQEIRHLILKECVLLQVCKIDVTALGNIFAHPYQHYSIIPGGNHIVLSSRKDISQILNQIGKRNILITENLLRRGFILVQAAVIQPQFLKKLLYMIEILLHRTGCLVILETVQLKDPLFERLRNLTQLVVPAAVAFLQLLAELPEDLKLIGWVIYHLALIMMTVVVENQLCHISRQSVGDEIKPLHKRCLGLNHGRGDRVEAYSFIVGCAER